MQQQQQQGTHAARLLSNGMACVQTRFTIDVSYNYRNVNLVEKEQQALSAIWNKCCKDDVNATTRAIVNKGNGEAPARVLAVAPLCSHHACRKFYGGSAPVRARSVFASAGGTSEQSDAAWAEVTRGMTSAT